MKGDKRLIIKLLLAALFLCMMSAWLASPGYSAENMSFHGTLREHPPCEINDGRPVEINFGEVGVNKIDGQNYAQTFKLTYECAGNGTNMVVRYMGVAAPFDSAAVESNIKDFGIKLSILSVDGVLKPFVVGTTLFVPSNQSESRFVATPVKKTGADLVGEGFTSSAMLQLEYP